MPSPLPARQQQPHLKLDTAMASGSPIVPTQYILDEYGTPGGSALATTRYPDISCHLLLLEAKLTMDGGLRTREKYIKAAGIARQALSLALQNNLPELESRANFYLGESTVIDVRRGQQHLIKAREYYSRALDGNEYGTPEAKRAASRLAELNVMFPTSNTSTSDDSSGSLPFATDSAPSLTSSPSWGPAQARANAHTAKIRAGERIPSFGSMSTDSSSVRTDDDLPGSDSTWINSPDVEESSDKSTVAAEYEFTSSSRLDNLLASIRSPIMSISPKTKQGLGIHFPKTSSPKTGRQSSSSNTVQPSSPLRIAQSPSTSTFTVATQGSSILKQQNAVDKTERSKSTSVSFSPETKTNDETSPTGALTHRRKRSSLSISQLQQRSDEALMEEGQSPVQPDF
ncbi:hypothetical protein AMS68_004611 [Peltaster fructicola]|uniref:Uncharacterized protein n=1 Tax=Peltaster fructicola TaxID=286661 RepID=A0A6H0XWI9_9PEZI|nr:hypothetical protein AMS68_004611 [Peltaster fructicola]